MTPKWAARIWVDSDFIHLELCSPLIGVDSSYYLKIPRTEKGLEQALSLISQRNVASTISTPGSPTKHQLEHVVKFTTVKPRKPRPLATPKQRATIRALIRKMENAL